MESRPPAAHRIIFAIDVEGFGARHRTNKNQIAVRDGLRQVWQHALTNAGISWPDCAVQDRGDGIMLLAPAETPKAPFVDSVPQEMVAALRQHNTTHPREEQIRLRMVLHAGEVELDSTGAAGVAIILACRLLDCPALKNALARSPGDLALITSDWFYSEVVRHSNLTEPATFSQVHIAVKETTATAWINLPGQPAPNRRLPPLPPARLQPFLRSLKTLWSGSGV